MHRSPDVSVECECRVFGTLAAQGRQRFKIAIDAGGRNLFEVDPVPQSPTNSATTQSGDSNASLTDVDARLKQSGSVPQLEIGRAPASRSDAQGRRQDYMIMAVGGVLEDTYQAWNPSGVDVTVGEGGWTLPSTWEPLRIAGRTLVEGLTDQPSLFHPPLVSVWTIRIRGSDAPTSPLNPLLEKLESDDFVRAVSGSRNPIIVATSAFGDGVAVKKLGTTQEQYLILSSSDSQLKLGSQLFTLFQVERDLARLHQELVKHAPELESRIALPLARAGSQVVGGTKRPEHLMKDVQQLDSAHNALVGVGLDLLNYTHRERDIDAHRALGLERMLQSHASRPFRVGGRTIAQEESETLDSHYVQPVRRTLKALEDDVSRAQVHVGSKIGILRGELDVGLARRLSWIQWTLIALAIIGAAFEGITFLGVRP